MELPKDVEEILSDDYEEGEILDEDNLYEEVSSLEEFSGGEFEPSQAVRSIVENDLVESASEKKLKHTKHHRKKEHKCKEDSICRKERKGKHCYARIRKEKQVTIAKVLDLPISFNDKHASKKTEIISIVKRPSPKFRQGSPGRLRQDSNKTYRHVDKDYHEKENRHTNKKHWPNNEKFSRNKGKQPEKCIHNKNKMKDHGKTRHYNTSILGSYHSDVDCNVENEHGKNQTFSKTSLLKRLVGSGNTGVKTLKENDDLINQFDSQSINKRTDASLPDPSEPLKSNDDILRDNVPTEVNSTSKKLPENLSENTESVSIDTEIPEVQTKKIELKWIRSMKDDKDELHLRVEALKSAWVKKFNERKKKGLIQHKKSELIDDSLVDFVLESDSEENDAVETISTNTSSQTDDKNNCCNIRFSVSDLSGDILKPEDMIIDKSSDTPIICEPLQIVTSSDSTNPAVNGSSVFIASSTLFSASQGAESSHELQGRRVDSSALYVNTSKSSKQLLDYSRGKMPLKESPRNQSVNGHLKTPNDLRQYKTSKTGRDRRSLSRSISRSDRKSIGKLRKKNRRKARRESLKNALNSLDVDDETALREQALLSLKSKTNRSLASQRSEGGFPQINIEPSTDMGSSTITKGNPLVSNFHLNKLTHLCESEATGATSSDNWEDDLDEDILRAQLLSSLTKQVSANSSKMAQTVDVLTTSPNINIQFNSNLRSQNAKKVIVRKQEKRRLKSINKKSWKQNIVAVSNQKVKLDDQKIRVKRFGKGNVFIKNDITLQVPINSQTNISPPIPQVPKLIISVNDSDSSTDNEELPQEPAISSTLQSDIEANIDLLLCEAKRNTQLEKLRVLPTPPDNSSNSNKTECFDKKQKPVDACMKFEESTSHVEVNLSSQVMDSKAKIQQPLSISSSSGASDSSGTPQALKHLPAWQQEEYRRLKKKIAEKEKVLQITRSKVVETLKETKFDERCVPSEHNSHKPDSTVSESSSEVNISKSEESSVKIPNESENSNNIPSDLPSTKSKHVNVHANYLSDDGSSSNADKKNYTTLASCSVMEEINLMNDIVNDFNKSSNEYTDLKTKWTRLQKAMKITETKMAMKRKKLLLVRDKIQEKDRVISSKISSISMTQLPANENKAPTRDMELIKLKYKELSLRAQFLFHDFSTEVINDDKPTTKGPLKDSQPTAVKDVNMKVPVSPLNRKRVLPDNKPIEKSKETTEPPMKRSFSAKEREREEWDPNTPVCHFDLNGICKDEECKYQHFKTV